MQRILTYLAVTAVFVLGGVFVGAQIDLQAFQPGQIIRSADVNANFTALRQAVEALATLPDGCAPGQVAKFDGSIWSCAADAGAGGGTDADTLDGLDSTDFALAGHVHNYPLDLFPMVGNGVGGSDCASGELEVLIYDASATPVDYRFTFFTPGANGGYGQIRSGGSIRSASANVASATHAGTGSYCIAFTVNPGAALESTVVGLATN